MKYRTYVVKNERTNKVWNKGADTVEFLSKKWQVGAFYWRMYTNENGAGLYPSTDEQVLREFKHYYEVD